MSYAFWNNGAPVRARVAGGGNRQRLAMPDGSIRMGRLRPDPAADLFAYSEFNEPSGPYRKCGPATYSNDGWTIHVSRSADWLPVEEIRAHRIRAVNAAANAILSPTDWYVVRGVEDPGNPIPNDVAVYRAAVRQAANDFVAAVAAETDPATAAALQPAWPDAPAILQG
jgi:hypothetical protein